MKESERENVVPDKDNVYLLAFPDTTYRKILSNQIINDQTLISFFDSNFNNVADLAVFYDLKYLDKQNIKYEIDYSKMPKKIVKNVQ